MKIQERREKIRLPLQWAVQLSHGPSGRLKTRTLNISGSGFYCVLPTAPTVGEVLECDIAFPILGRGSLARKLRCRSEVVRVETRGREEGFGVACRFLEYGLIPSQFSSHN